MNYREIILRMVNANHGLNSVDLALKVMSEINPNVFSVQQFMEAVEDLELDGEIFELPYTTPETINGTERIRLNTIYLPKGTRICVPFITVRGIK